MNPLIQLKQTTSVFLIAFGLTCFALSTTVQAVSPAPDGGYTGMNTAEGDNALLSLTTGINNTAIGWKSLKSITTTSNNTAVGAGALFHNTTANGNTATGSEALLSNTTGSQNTADGVGALNDNKGPNGFANTATGFHALVYNGDGAYNTADGSGALFFNTRGYFNTACGDLALFGNTNGLYNTACGDQALSQTVGGENGNTSVGAEAMEGAENGQMNTAIGILALNYNTGNNNTAIGMEALISNTTGQSNVALGDQAGSNLTTGSNNIDIGAFIDGIAGESNACRIGSIFGQTAANGSAVVITSGHKLGTATSSERFKENINPMNRASEVIFSLKPVAFRYKKEIDPERIPQFGLVAEDVEKVNRDLIVRDQEGKPYSVRYDQVNAMLLNEFLKEHPRVQNLEQHVEKLTADLQKVNAQIESSKPAPRVVNNP